MKSLYRRTACCLWLSLFAILVSAHFVVAAPFDDCKEHLPFGVPSLTKQVATTPVCYVGYVALHDDTLLIPRWVAYRLTGPHTHGCIARANNFHADDNLPEGKRALPADYKGSGFDQGHQAPAQDFAWNLDRNKESFSMVNMAPQLPGLNRAQWLRLEETVRGFAAKRGAVIVYVGPIVINSGHTIGKNKVAVPIAFWKVIVDPEKKEAIGFVLPQRKIAKGKLEPWQADIARIEESAGLKLPLPEGIVRDKTPELWSADLASWRADQKRLCPPKKSTKPKKPKKPKKKTA